LLIKGKNANKKRKRSYELLTPAEKQIEKLKKKLKGKRKAVFCRRKAVFFSLHTRKRFRVVSEQRKTE